jgi:hypothetical protein
MIKEPAFLAIFLIRTSDCWMKTPLDSFSVPMARLRRDFWYGAAALKVASTGTANRVSANQTTKENKFSPWKNNITYLQAG